MTQQNFSMLCDFYALTMANGFFENSAKEKRACFDVFFRRVPENGGYAVFAGLSDIIDFIENLHFSSDDIDFLRSKKVFSENFLDFLSDFHFTGDIRAVKEGSPVFPNEPLLIIKGKLQEILLLETFILQTVNHQSLIATKASRISRAASSRAVIEMGARRSHGESAAVKGARAAYIGGITGTTNVLANKLFDIPLYGSMSHAWVQMFDDEKTAFRVFCETYPDNPTLLVDTFNTLESGIPNAVEVFRELNIKKCAVRIDSGDIAYLSKQARKMLDNAELQNCLIAASNALDEYLIKDLINQGARVDIFGVGENLITAKSQPVFGAVMKLTAVQNENGELIPKIKLSENKEKITTPHFKNLYRYYSKKTGLALADEITVFDETVNDDEPRLIFAPDDTRKNKILTHYKAKQLLVPVFENGKCVYTSPTLSEIRKHCKQELDLLWDEIKRFENPHGYYVDLSPKLWQTKTELTENFQFL